MGIKTAFGELLVDPAAKKWMLLDSDGNTLADWAPLAEFTGSGMKDERIHLSVGPSPATPKPLYYGSGNVPDFGALTQTEAHSQTGNGSAALPQYWSTAHYGALMISENETRPGSWKANVAGGVDWKAPGVAADLYLMPAKNLYDWLRDDAELTGFAPVPPLWAFGYLQSRWGWTDKSYLDDTLAHFRKDNLPVDTFIIDFEWYTKTPDYDVKAEGDPTFIDFDWNPVLFPDPISQIADFAQQGLHIVGIRKPRIGNTENLVMARSKGWILPVNPDDPNGGNIRSRDLDFSRPEVRTWWEGNNRKFLEAGMAGFWNDEGETNFTEYTYWNMAEFDLLKQVDLGARFWSINRSFAPGMQRFGAAVWTGDIGADWDTLANTPGEILSYGLSGMPYSGCDIGGFFGDPTPELLTRWMEAGVFFPIIRSHSINSSKPHFPWLFGQEAEDAIRKALDLRYQLIPYYYSLAHNDYLTGAPLMRPLVMEFPDDPKVSGLTDEWLMGKGLLAAPILQQGGERDVYLPNDQWFSFGTNQMTQGPQTVHVTSKLDEIPVYVRAGTLLPLGPVLQYTSQPSTEPLELQIYPGRDGTFTLAEDDGKTLAYQKGAVRFITFSWNDHTKTLSWKTGGNFKGDNRFTKMKAVLFGPEGPITKETPYLNFNSSITFP
ncbi:MAG TPA: TIM-barrel domain-containing protein [Candidatus Methylacidiphilales bacterium]|nr:TIM-barrel domain-containing protein [Candidatus Methylacidiphilales bacterium]